MPRLSSLEVLSVVTLDSTRASTDIVIFCPFDLKSRGREILSKASYFDTIGVLV